MDELRKGDPDGYEHFVKIHEGKGHWMNLEDKAALPWMAKFTRNPVPARVVWKQTGTPHDRSYWLAVPAGQGKVGTLVTAKRDGQAVEVTAAEGVGKLLVRLDDRMADLDKPVTVTHAGSPHFSPPAAIARRRAAIRSFIRRVLMPRGHILSLPRVHNAAADSRPMRLR